MPFEIFFPYSPMLTKKRKGGKNKNKINFKNKKKEMKKEYVDVMDTGQVPFHEI